SGELAQPAAQVGERADVERVHRFLAIDRDEGDRLFALDSNQTGTLPLRKSTIRFPPRPFPTRRHECFMPGPCLAGSRRFPRSAHPARRSPSAPSRGGEPAFPPRPPPPGSPPRPPPRRPPARP